MFQQKKETSYEFHEKRYNHSRKEKLEECKKGRIMCL